MMSLMQGQRGFRPGLFVAAIGASLVGIVIVGTASRLVPVGPVARMGLVGFVLVGGILFATVKKRWDVAIAASLTVLAAAVLLIWLASNVVPNWD